MTGMALVAGATIGAGPAQASSSSSAITEGTAKSESVQQKGFWRGNQRVIGYYRSPGACLRAGRIGERRDRWDDYRCIRVGSGFHRRAYALVVRWDHGSWGFNDWNHHGWPGGSGAFPGGFPGRPWFPGRPFPIIRPGFLNGFPGFPGGNGQGGFPGGNNGGGNFPGNNGGGNLPGGNNGGGNTPGGNNGGPSNAGGNGGNGGNGGAGGNAGDGGIGGPGAPGGNGGPGGAGGGNTLPLTLGGVNVGVR